MTKKLSLTKTFIATLVLSFVIGTTSCSHQETKDGWEGIKDGASADSSSSSSDMKLSSDDSSASTSSNEVAATEEKKEEKKDEVAPASDLTATLEKKDDAAPAPSEAPKADLASVEPAKTDAPAPTESLAPSASPEVAAAPQPEASAAPSMMPAADTTKPMDSVAATESIAPSASPEASLTMDNKSLETASTEPTLVKPTSGEEETKEEKATDSKSVVSHVPSVPSAPVEKAGQSLNRYYFIRKGDTPATVASKVGSPAKSFHVKGWKVGHFVMYPSTQNAADKNVVAHHAEAGIAATSYTVKAGDSLSSIAKDVYGDLRSWTEIAVDNHIANPDQIAKGTVINLFNGEATTQTTAANDQDNQDDAVTDADTQASTDTWKPDTKVAAAPVAAPAQSPAPVAAAPAPVKVAEAPAPAKDSAVAPIDNGKLFPAANDKVAREAIPELASPVADLPVPGKATPAVDKNHQKSSFASMEVVQFVQRNLFMVMMALGAMGFLVYAALLKARRSRADSDF